MKDANGVLIVIASLALVFMPDNRMALLGLLGVLIAVKLFQGWRNLRRKA